MAIFDVPLPNSAMSATLRYRITAIVDCCPVLEVFCDIPSNQDFLCCCCCFSCVGGFFVFFFLFISPTLLAKELFYLSDIPSFKDQLADFLYLLTSLLSLLEKLKK